MSGRKETYEIELNPDHMGFIRTTKEQFNIASESKVMRIVLDYLQTNPNIHNTVFSETRCLRCE